MQELHIREQSVLQSFNSNGITGNRITNSQEITERMHNKEYQLYFANGDLKKEKDVKAGVCFWCTVLIFHRDLRDYLTEQIEMAFFLIAQWHKVPFQNTNTLVEVYRRRACNFKEAVAETLSSQSAHVSAQTRSQLCQERKCVCDCVSKREGERKRKKKKRGIISSCCQAEVVIAWSFSVFM